MVAARGIQNRWRRNVPFLGERGMPLPRNTSTSIADKVTPLERTKRPLRGLRTEIAAEMWDALRLIALGAILGAGFLHVVEKWPF